MSFPTVTGSGSLPIAALLNPIPQSDSSDSVNSVVETLVQWSQVREFRTLRPSKFNPIEAVRDIILKWNEARPVDVSPLNQQTNVKVHQIKDEAMVIQTGNRSWLYFFMPSRYLVKCENDQLTWLNPPDQNLTTDTNRTDKNVPKSSQWVHDAKKAGCSFGQFRY